jgi:hypothetical protein
MGRRAQVVPVLGAIALLALFSGVASARLTVADYKLNDSLASSIPGAAPLSHVGVGNAFATETVRGRADRVVTFPEGNGLSLVDPGLVPNDNYSVVLAFRFSSLGTYDRILDTDGEADHGLYQHFGALAFHDSDSVNHEGSPGVIEPNEYVEVGFTRNPSERIAGYVNGVRQFSYLDENPDQNALIGPEGLRFFLDDGSEEAPGAVARIRVFNRALTAEQVEQVFEGCTVPNVEGMKLRRAKRKLRNAGCSVGRVTRRFSDRVEKGRVIRQRPRRGADRDFEFAVRLKVSKGPED